MMDVFLEVYYIKGIYFKIVGFVFDEIGVVMGFFFNGYMCMMCLIMMGEEDKINCGYIDDDIFLFLIFMGEIVVNYYVFYNIFLNVVILVLEGVW